MKKTVTIAIPVYNGEKYILEALQSAIDQTLKADKIFICDNCSNDNTVAIVNTFITDHSAYDIELSINDENIGFQQNFYKCFELSKTDYLVVLHADDVLKPDTLEKQLNFFYKHKELAVVGGNVDTIDAVGNVITKSKETKDIIFKRNEILEFIKTTRSYIPETTIMYDLKMTSDISQNKEESLGPEELYWPVLLQKHSMAVLGDSLIYNRIHDDQLHLSYGANKFEKYKKHFKDLLELANLERGEERKRKTRKILIKQVSLVSINIGNDLIDSGKHRGIALKYYLCGVNINYGIIFTKYFLKSMLKAIGLYN